MDLACAEFIMEDLWLWSLRDTNPPIVDSDSEPLRTESQMLSVASPSDPL